MLNDAHTALDLADAHKTPNKSRLSLQSVLDKEGGKTLRRVLKASQLNCGTQNPQLAAPRKRRMNMQTKSNMKYVYNNVQHRALSDWNIIYHFCLILFNASFHGLISINHLITRPGHGAVLIP